MLTAVHGGLKVVQAVGKCNGREIWWKRLAVAMDMEDSECWPRKKYRKHILLFNIFDKKTFFLNNILSPSQNKRHN
jgi:hypothetical protein